MKSESKDRGWFIKVRESYLPSNAKGYGIYFLYITYLVALIWAWIMEGPTFWTFVIYIVPLSVASAWLTQYIASKHAR